MDPDAAVLACDMSALSTEERAHHLATIRSLFGAVQAVHELSSGYEFRFRYSSDSLHTLADFISHEKRCCPFFGFRVNVEPEAESVSLHLSGPAGVKPFILAELGSALPSHLLPGPLPQRSFRGNPTYDI